MELYRSRYSGQRPGSSGDYLKAKMPTVMMFT